MYPLMRNTEVDGKVVPGISSQQQALNQLAATACTLAIAIAGKMSNTYLSTSVGEKFTNIPVCH